MHQMHQAIEKMEGKPCAILGDGEWGIPYTKPDGTPGRKLSKFTVGMVQTLAQRLEIKTVDAEMKALQARRANEVSKKIEEKINQKIDQATDSTTIDKIIDKILELI